MRRSDESVVLCVHNLARSTQAVTLDLAAFAGAVPVELVGGVSFPRITAEPYVLTLEPRGFYWLRLGPPGRPAPPDPTTA